MAQNKNYTSLDKFGQEFQVIGCKPSKKNPDFSRGYIEIKGQLYMIEPSESKKENVAMWVRVTKMKKRTTGSF